MAAPTPSAKKKPILSRKAKRIVFFFGLLVALPAVIAGALTPQNLHQEAATPTDKPNVLVITVADQRADTLSSMKHVREAIAAQGMTFTNAYAVADWNETSLQNALQKAGYHTASVGTEGQPIERIGDDAKEAITRAQEPYFLSVHFSASSGAVASETCSAVAPIANPAVNEADVSDKSRSIRSLPVFTPAQLNELRATQTAQLCRLQAIDNVVGDLLSTLGTNRAHMVVVYAGTSGYAWGEHRLTGSTCLYDSCRHIPLVISYPVTFRTALTARELVQIADITPTVLQLAGMTDTKVSDSVSLVPLFTRPDVPVHEKLLVKTEGGIAVRTKEFLYLTQGQGGEEFYDLVADPLELQNQVNNADYKQAIDRLKTGIAGLTDR